MTDNALLRIPVITQAILQAQPLHYHTQKLDELEVLHLLADKMKATIEIKNDIGEAQVRIYRDAGQRLSSVFKRGGNGSNQYAKRAKGDKQRLADFGYTTKIAGICRTIAALPDDLFEDLILGIRTSEHITHDEITISLFRTWGAIHIDRTSGTPSDKPQPVQVDIDLELARFVFMYAIRMANKIFNKTTNYNDYDHVSRAESEDGLDDAIEAYKAQKGSDDVD